MAMTTFEQIAINIRPRLLELCERFLTMRQLPNQTFDLVEEVKDSIHHIRITDRILARFSSLHGEFQLLCIDHVEGKYLIPEEWHRILNYKFGKKKYLK